MKKGRKKGEFKKARKRHLMRQSQSDALKKLREGEPVEIMAWDEYGLKKFLVHPFSDGEPMNQDKILCLFGRKLRVMIYVEKDGSRVINRYHNTILNPKYYFGLVISEV